MQFFVGQDDAFVGYVKVMPERFEFLFLVRGAEVGRRHVSEESRRIVRIGPGVVEYPACLQVSPVEGAGYKRNNILIRSKNCRVAEVVPCGLQNLAEDRTSSGERDRVLDLAQKPAFATVSGALRNCNEVVRVKSVDLSLKLNFCDRPVRKTWPMSAREHQCNEGCLYVPLEMNAEPASGRRVR